MNAVEIEEAVSKLADVPFNAETFAFDFLQAFGLNDAGICKLKSGDANKSDVPRGVLQRNKNNIHLLACPPGEVAAAMDALRASPATAKFQARFILATDGQALQSERFDDGEPLACEFKQLPDRFAFFLSLAGISTVKRIDENAFDIRATGRLNKLYVELLQTNPDWDSDGSLIELGIKVDANFAGPAAAVLAGPADTSAVIAKGHLAVEHFTKLGRLDGRAARHLVCEVKHKMGLLAGGKLKR